MGAGHRIPTGVTEDREMWLELTVNDSEGRILYHSGALDSEGKIDLKQQYTIRFLQIQRESPQLSYGKQNLFFLTTG